MTHPRRSENTGGDLDSQADAESNRSGQNGIDTGSDEDIVAGQQEPHQGGFDEFKKGEQESEKKRSADSEAPSEEVPDQRKRTAREKKEQRGIGKHLGEKTNRDRAKQGKRKSVHRTFEKAALFPDHEQDRCARAVHEILKSRARPIEDSAPCQKNSHKNAPPKTKDNCDSILVDDDNGMFHKTSVSVNNRFRTGNVQRSMDSDEISEMWFFRHTEREIDRTGPQTDFHRPRPFLLYDFDYLSLEHELLR